MDVLVLGAGIVGVSVAIHLVARGHAVTLVDRAAPGGGTSFGNAGLIQSEGVLPRAFPQSLGAILRYGLNASTDMHFHPRALPGLAPFLWAYWRASHPGRYQKIVRDYARLIAEARGEHAVLVERAGAEGLIEKSGWYKLFQSPAQYELGVEEAEWLAREFGIAHARLEGAALRALDPALKTDFAGAVHWTEPWTVRDPGALVAAYARHFAALGGRIETGDARELRPDGAGWRVGALSAGHAVIALGPWSVDLTRALGYRLPLAAKRGYHMHYRPDPQAPLGHWMLDAEGGYLVSPMRAGIRMTTGVEFAARDAALTPVQVERAERTARTRFAMGARLDPVPWMGSRPATPDMLPLIGPAPRHEGLWFAFGHAHHGLTLGPATGRLIAEMMAGETPFVHPAPFSATRFTRI